MGPFSMTMAAFGLKAQRGDQEAAIFWSAGGGISCLCCTVTGLRYAAQFVISKTQLPSSLSLMTFQIAISRLSFDLNNVAIAT